MDSNEKKIPFANLPPYGLKPHEIEAALDQAYAIEFVGGRRENLAARYIARNSGVEIARVRRKREVALPTSPEWWINNRNDIYSALLAIKENEQT